MPPPPTTAVQPNRLKCKIKDAAGKSCGADAVFGHPGDVPERCENHKEADMEKWGKKALLDWMCLLDSDDARRAMTIIELIPEDDARFLNGPPCQIQPFYTLSASMHDKRMAALGYWVVQTVGVCMYDGYLVSGCMMDF